MNFLNLLLFLCPTLMIEGAREEVVYRRDAPHMKNKTLFLFQMGAWDETGNPTHAHLIRVTRDCNPEITGWCSFIIAFFCVISQFILDSGAVSVCSGLHAPFFLSVAVLYAWMPKHSLLRKSLHFEEKDNIFLTPCIKTVCVWSANLFDIKGTV